MPFDEINRGVITFSPCVDKAWVDELTEEAKRVDGFHICNSIENSDGSMIVTFCDGESCPETSD